MRFYLVVCNFLITEGLIMEKISFSQMFLFKKNNNFLNVEDFKNLPKEDKYDKNGVFYIIETEIIENSFVWIYMRYGKPKPYSDELLDTQTRLILPNKRQPNQAELRNQLFLLYSIQEHILYISDIRKASVLKDYLNERTNLGFECQRIFKTPEEFVEIIDNLKEISFTFLPKSESNDKVYDKIPDFFGHDSPSVFSMKLSYDGVDMKIIDKINFLKKMKENKNKFKRITYRGKDKDGENTAFNWDSITRKLTIEATADDNGFFMRNHIKLELIKEIKSNQYAE